MRYEIAMLLRSLEEYHARTGGYHPVDTETIGAAIEKLKAAYRLNLPDLHEETIVEIMHAKTVILLATALSDSDRDVAVALQALRLSEQQQDEQDPQHPAFHINWHDERWKLLNYYGQLLARSCACAANVARVSGLDHEPSYCGSPIIINTT